MLVGGGTSGHITPLLAVAHELKAADADIHLVYVGERHGKFAHVLSDQPDLATYTIFAGKFRRYHGESWRQRLLDVRTNLLNLRDLLWAFIGFWQSLGLLYKTKPEVIFIKGGFVGVPVGLAAACLRIPYITHDSDTMSGIANRIIAHWARAHAVGMPKEFYTYPPEKTYFVGIPVSPHYTLVTPELQQQYRQKLGLSKEGRVVFITGGSNGAQQLNNAVIMIIEALLSKYPDLHVIHQVGAGNDSLYQALPPALSHRVVYREYIPDLYVQSGAADVVITRAGATALAEFAVQAKACVVVPNPLLTGGHQLKNAKRLADAGAVLVVTEALLKTTPSSLLKPLQELLDSPHKRRQLGKALHAFGQPTAAKELASLLLKIPKETIPSA